MSGSYDECAGADDTMDSFWEVQNRRPSALIQHATLPPPKKSPEARVSLVLIRLLEPSRVPTETMKMRLVSLSFYRKINARSCRDAV